MKTFFSAVTGYPGARSHFLDRLACIAFVSGSTISLSFAGFPDAGVRGSGGSFVGPVQRIGFRGFLTIAPKTIIPDLEDV